MRLPLQHRKVVSNGGGAEQSKAKARDNAGSISRRVLVIDDNSDAAETLAELLQSFGHHVRIARTGPEAIEAVAALRPEVVLLDIGMPGMDGYEVARRLRDQPGLETTKVVALSGYGSQDDRRRALEAGFDAHLVKPIDINALTSILSNVKNIR